MRETVNDAYVGAGLPGRKEDTPGRALCLLDRLHRDGAISTEMWMAGNQLRQQIAAEMPPSEGISPAYDATGRAEPSRKADRRGRRLTGFDVSQDGTVTYAGGRRNKANLRELEDALFAAVGLHDVEHKRIADLKHVDILMRVCVDSEKMPTREALAMELTPWVTDKKTGKPKPYYSGEKQLPPFAVGHIRVWLGRLAQYYRLAK